MAEEQKPGKGSEFFFKHGEKVVLVAAALALVAYLVLGIAMAKEDGNVRKVELKAREIQGEKRKSHEDMKAPEARTKVPEALDPWTKVIAANTPKDPKDDWVGTLAPVLVYKEFVVHKDPKKNVKVPEIQMGRAEVALDGVTVHWAATGFPAAQITKEKAGFEFLKLSHFSVEREAAGSGKWEMLAEKVAVPEPPKTEKGIAALPDMSFRDVRIDPKSKYNYRVTAFLDAETVEKLDPEKVNTSEIDKATKKLATVATAAPVETLGIWKLRFINTMKGQAYIEIEKFEKALGKPVKVALIHHEGDRIGGKKADPEEEPAFDHTVPVGDGKSQKVNFNTGMVLLKVEPVRLTVEVARCKPQFTSDGKKIGCERVVDKIPFETKEIVYKDEDGREVKLQIPDPKTSSRTQDQLCDEHGGRKIVTELPKEADPEAPKEDPRIADARAREKAASDLFAEAQMFEIRGDKRNAVTRYEKLLKEYADTDFVSKQKKAVVEDRLKRLKQ